jgi:hypothetical protein
MMQRVFSVTVSISSPLIKSEHTASFATNEEREEFKETAFSHFGAKVVSERDDVIIDVENALSIFAYKILNYVERTEPCAATSLSN